LGNSIASDRGYRQNLGRRPKRAVRRGRLLWTLLGLVVMGWGAAKFAPPYLLAHAQAQELAELGTQVQGLREESAQLQLRARELAPPEGLQLEARRQGWVAKGERRLVFLKPRGVAEAELNAASSAKRSGQAPAAKCAALRALARIGTLVGFR